MQQARALQQSEAFAEYCQRRVVVEHRLARLVQLGIRQATSDAPNPGSSCTWPRGGQPALVAGKAGITGETGAAPRVDCALIAGIPTPPITGSAWLGQLGTLILLASASLPNPSSQHGLSGQASRDTLNKTGRLWHTEVQE